MTNERLLLSLLDYMCKSMFDLDFSKTLIKCHLSYSYLNWNSSLIIKSSHLKLSGYIDNMSMQGIVSQNLDFGPGCHFMSKKGTFLIIFDFFPLDFIK